MLGHPVEIEQLDQLVGFSLRDDLCLSLAIPVVV